MGEKSPKLLNLMKPKEESECLCVNGVTKKGLFDEKKLELKLGLPSEFDWQNKRRSGNFLSNCANCASGGKNVACYQTRVNTTTNTNTNTSQKRAAPTSVVGWPPVRSFRKNLASSSSAKTSAEPQNENPSKPVNAKQPTENKGLFVKINMDGVPIGRKVDLNAYNCYDKLSSAVDTLFSGLLAAQKNSSPGGIEKKQDEPKLIVGLLDGTGEYTLVYEDNEGDRMLVGDVPWHMFVSTVKRLRVLKSSDLPTLSRGTKQGKEMVEGASK